MEYNELDQLFRNGLEKEMSFDNQDSQWKLVKARLAEKGNKRFFIWIPLLVLASAIAYGTGSFLSNVLNTDRNISVSESQLEPAKEPIRAVGKDKIHENKSLSNASEVSDATIPVKAISAQEKTSDFVKSVQNDVSAPIISGPAVSDLVSDIQNNIPKTGLVVHSNKGRKMYVQESSVNDSLADYDKIEVQVKSEQIGNSLLDQMAKIDLEIAKLNYQSKLVENFEFITTSPKRRKSFGVAAELGVNSEFISDNALVNRNSINPYLGIELSYGRRMALSFLYSQRNINRIFGENLGDYAIPIISNPFESELPDSTNLGYNNASLDALVVYDLWKSRYFDLGLSGGIQFNRNSEIQVDYTYIGVYQQEFVEETISTQAWHLSDFSVGIQAKLPINHNFSLVGNYQYYVSLNSSHFRWRNRQIWRIGINYKFYDR